MSKKIIEILEENFPQQKFELYEGNYGGSINAFFIKSSNEKLLNDTWEKIRNMIGVYFQSKLESEFDIWNIYLFYITDDVSKELKHRIEHDTISSRKIVIDSATQMSDSDFKDFLFSEHITNMNLNINVSGKENIKFSKNKIFSSIIDKIDLSKAKKNKEDFFGVALEQIEKSLTDEI
jgi:hypothetical protein